MKNEQIGRPYKDCDRNAIIKEKLEIKMTHNGVVTVDLSGDNGKRLVENIIDELDSCYKPTKGNLDSSNPPKGGSGVPKL